MRLRCRAVRLLGAAAAMAACLPGMGCGGGGGGGGGGGEDPRGLVMAWTSASEMESVAGVKSMLFPHLAFFEDGRAVAAWMEVLSGGTCQIATMLYVPGSGWRDRIALGACNNNSRPIVKIAEVAGEERAYVAWRTESEEIALRQFDGKQWQEAVRTVGISTSLKWLGVLSVHILSDGKAVVLMQASDKTNDVFPPARNYAVAFGDDGYVHLASIGSPSYGSYLAVVVDDREEFHIVQRESAARTSPPGQQWGSIRYCRFSYDDLKFASTWRTPIATTDEVVRETPDLANVLLAMGPAGDLRCFWIEATPQYDVQNRLIRSHGPLKTKLVQGEATAETLDGDVEAAYLSSEGCRLLIVRSGELVSMGMDGAGAQRVAQTPGRVGRVALASDGAGSGAVLWDERIADSDDAESEAATFDNNAHEIRLIRYDSKTGWQQPQTLVANHKDSARMIMAFDLRGNGLALWDQRVDDTRWDSQRFYRSVWVEDRKILFSRFQ